MAEVQPAAALPAAAALVDGLAGMAEGLAAVADGPPLELHLPLEPEMLPLLHARDPAPLTNSLLLLATALLVLLIFHWLGPPTPQSHLTWTLAPQGEIDRRRIRNLLLPTKALVPSDQSVAPTESPSKLSLEVVRRVQAVGCHISAAAGLESLTRRPNFHNWVFKPNGGRDTEYRDCTPLLVFVNRSSGGRQGEETLSQLRALLSEQQVLDLSTGHAEDLLRSFRTVGRFRVLVCGGDGTVGWVLSLLDGAGMEYTPPVAILPLGTGNDLARYLRTPWALPQPVHTAYIGIGVDAKVALEWHRKRQLDPNRFRSVLRNKIRYARYGARHLFVVRKLLRGLGLDREERDFSELCSQLTIEADGRPIALPPGTEGVTLLSAKHHVIILNIASYGGGSDLWGAELSHLWDTESSLDELLQVDDASFEQPFAIDEHEGEMSGFNSPSPRSAHEELDMPSVTSPGRTPHAHSGTHRRTPSSGSWNNGFGSSTRSSMSSKADLFDAPSMDDGKLEVVAVQGVHQLALAQMSLSRARRLCQCSTLTITSKQRLPIQIDGEPMELEPTYAPRKPLRITVRLYNQAVMLSRSKVRADGVALEALDRALQEGIISVDQRNWVLREVARRNGCLQRRALSTNSFGGSNLSIPSLLDQY